MKQEFRGMICLPCLHLVTNNSKTLTTVHHIMWGLIYVLYVLVYAVGNNLYVFILIFSDDGSETTKILGKKKRVQRIEQVNELSLENLENQSLFKFYRLRRCHDILYSKEYSRMKSRNSYTVRLIDGTFGIISYFVEADQKFFVVFQKLQTMDEPIVKASLELPHECLHKYNDRDLCMHIKRVKLVEERKLIDAHSVAMKCVNISFEDCMCVSFPPNLLEHS